VWKTKLSGRTQGPKLCPSRVSGRMKCPLAAQAVHFVQPAYSLVPTGNRLGYQNILLYLFLYLLENVCCSLLRPPQRSLRKRRVLRRAFRSSKLIERKTSDKGVTRIKI